jgi:hypothetical protein
MAHRLKVLESFHRAGLIASLTLIALADPMVLWDLHLHCPALSPAVVLKAGLGQMSSVMQRQS